MSNLNERIENLAKLDLANDPSPECTLMGFKDIMDLDNPFEAAYRIAEIYKARCGLVMVSAKSSYEMSDLSTIMDALEDRENHEDNEIIMWIFEKAFKKAGFKNAKDCDATLLKNLVRKVERANVFINVDAE